MGKERNSWKPRPGGSNRKGVELVAAVAPLANECGQRVSEWDTGLELMQEWKTGPRSKGSVCKGIWGKGIGMRPAVRRAVSTLQSLKSKRRKPIAFRRLELPPRNTSNQPARILNGRRELP